MGLALSFKLRYNKDIFGIWAMIENMFRESLHHYSTLELARMKYGSCTIFPKSFSLKTSKAINDIVFNELHNVRDMNELIHILHAFRNVSSLQNYNKLIEEICKRTLKNTLEAVHLLFVFSHAKYPNYKRKLLREKD